MTSNKFWIFLLGGVVIISALTALALRQAPSSIAHVYKNGELIESLDLNAIAEPFTFTVSDGDSVVNVISVEHGRLCVSGASCPDKSCIHQGWTGGGYVPIVCLPNRLLIRFDNNGSPDLDAVAR